MSIWKLGNIPFWYCVDSHENFRFLMFWNSVMHQYPGLIFLKISASPALNNWSFREWCTRLSNYICPQIERPEWWHPLNLSRACWFYRDIIFKCKHNYSQTSDVYQVSWPNDDNYTGRIRKGNANLVSYCALNMMFMMFKYDVYWTIVFPCL